MSAPTPSRRPRPRPNAACELKLGLGPLVPDLRARALRLCGNPGVADDVVQDTVERALRFAHHYTTGTNLRAWLFQVLFRVYVTRWRRVARERRALDRLSHDPHAWTVPCSFAPPDAGAGAISRSTERSLDALPASFRAVVVLVDIEERSYRDAARELGVPVGTVMSRLHRGRKLLAERVAA